VTSASKEKFAKFLEDVVRMCWGWADYDEIIKTHDMSEMRK
jgi:hypothetical protein